MKSKSLPKGFPTSPEEWEKLISEAPGDDGPPTPEEEAAWKDAVVSYSFDEHRAKMLARRKRGKGKAPAKVLTAIRFDPDVLEGLRATGRGWQRFVNDTMRARLKEMAS